MKTVISIVVALSLTGAAVAETIRMAVSAVDLRKGDPFERYSGGSVKSALFDGLTQIALTGEVRPALALSWTAVNDTTWVFNLRPDAHFHNGKPVTAAAIVEMLGYLRSDDARRYWMALQMAPIVAARAVDDLTLEFITKEPDPLMPRRMSMLNVADMAAWCERGAVGFAERPIGTGPYRLKSWGPNGTDIHVTAFEGAWRQHRGVTAAEMKVITDGTRRMQALMSGEVDIAINLEPDMLGPLREAGFKLVTTPNPIVVAIAFRTVDAAGSPVTDARVRRALNLAVNRTAISESILLGLMLPASQGATPGTVGYNAALAPFAYDPARARALLAEAGYPDGFALTFGVWTGQVPGDAAMFQQVAQDLAAVGVRVNLRVLPFPDFSRRLQTGDWDGIHAFSMNWTSRQMLDLGTTFESFSCRRFPTPVFCDPTLDAIFDRAGHIMDSTARTALLESAMAATLELVPSIFLVNYAEIAATKAGISGYEVRSDGVMLEKLTVSPGR